MFHLLNVQAAKDTAYSLGGQIFEHQKDGEALESNPVLPPEQANLIQIIESNVKGINLTLLGGRPGMGKTSFALQAAVQAAKAGKTVYFCSPEHSPEQLLWRAVIQTGAVNSLIKPESKFNDATLAAIEKALDDIAPLPLYFVQTDDKGLNVLGPTISPDDFVIVDGLDRFEENIRDDVSTCRNFELKLLKPVPESYHSLLVTTNVKRVVERRKDKRPKPADLMCEEPMRFFGSTVLSLYRPNYYDCDGSDTAEVARFEVEMLPKVHHKLIGTEHFRFDGRHCVFSA